MSRSLFPSTMAEKSFFVARGLFPPRNNSSPKEKDCIVGEEISNVSLESSLSFDNMSTATATEGLSSEFSHVSLELSLSISKDYICSSKGKTDPGTDKLGNNWLKPKEGGLSLDLNLGFEDNCSTSKKRQRRSVWSCRNKTSKADEDKVVLRLGVGHELHDPWCIKKQLSESDLGNMSRLMLPSDSLESHVFPLWNDDELARIKEGLAVWVWDCDTKTEHEMVFKQWNKGANVLIKNWVKKFVKRRELKLGDEIGLYWDKCTSRFNFSVLSRASSH